MVEFTSRIENKIGLHLRAAGEFVKIASRFRSKVTVILDGRKADGKSILSLASLAVGRGAEIVVQVEGEDEREAKEALQELVANNFNEE